MYVITPIIIFGKREMVAYCTENTYPRKKDTKTLEEWLEGCEYAEGRKPPKYQVPDKKD